MRSPIAVFKDLTGVRDGDLHRLLLMFVYLLLVITCYTTTKAVRDSLFVVQIGPSQLPYLYLLIAGVMAIFSAVYSRALHRAGLNRLTAFTSIFSVSSLLIFWWVVNPDSPAWFYILYVWVSLFGVISASQVWALATHVFDAREARRVFGWIGVGGIAGGIAGGALTRFVAPRLGTEFLLPVCAVLMATTLPILHRVGRFSNDQGQSTKPELQGNWAIFNQVRQSRHLSLLVMLLGFGVIVEAFADYEFKVVARQAFESKDQLTAFFGTLSSYGGLLALLVQMIVTSRFLKRFGVGPAILLFPSALLIAFLIIAVNPTLWAVAILRLIDSGLSYSIHRSGMELLYVPIPSKHRNAIKGFIDMFVDRAGRAAGGLLLLLLSVGLSLSVSGLSLVAGGFLIAWIASAVAVRRQYLQAFRSALEKKTIEPEALDIRTADWGTVGTLVNALSSSDERQVLYALGLLEKVHPQRWRAHWSALIRHPSGIIRARTIGLLAEWHDRSMAPLIQAALHDSEIQVRVEAIRYFCRIATKPVEKLAEFIRYGDYQVVYAAIQCMARYGLGDPRQVGESFVQHALEATGEHAEIARAAAACALDLNWTGSPDSVRFLNKLLDDASPEVVNEAIRTCGNVRLESAIPALINRLSDSRFRRTAREALLKFGDPAIPRLVRSLSDRSLPLAIRRRIPKVLAYTGKQEAAEALMAGIHNLHYDLDYPLIRALSKMRVDSLNCRFDAEQVSAVIRGECDQHRHLRELMKTLGAAPAEPHDERNAAAVLAMLHKALGERTDQRLERVFRLMGLIHAPEDMYSAYLSCRLKPELRASAVEFLDNLLQPPLKDWIIPLLDEAEGPDPEAPPAPAYRENALQILIAGDDLWLRTIAADAAKRLGKPELAGALRGE